MPDTPAPPTTITAPTIAALRAEAERRGMRVAAIRPTAEGFSAMLLRPEAFDG